MPQQTLSHTGYAGPTTLVAPRVLVLGADFTERTLYRELLGDLGFTVIPSTVSLPADTIRRLRPDLILVDTVHAWKDGRDVVQRLRRDPELRSIPCVVCNGAVAHGCGMDDDLASWHIPVLTKPFDLEHLGTVVHSCLERSSTPPPPDQLTPHALAQLHNAYVSALWRGNDVSDVTDWLEAHWNGQVLPEPDGNPDAISYFGGNGRGIGVRWYRRDSSIIGYPPGVPRGCYQVSVAESLPAVPGLLHAGHMPPEHRDETLSNASGGR